ncbi:MAG: hypothetical protein RLZZ524_367 [Pseudomonadota bacterium]
MADALVRIVINAVDQASGVLTGLNQGAELAIKAFNGLAASASFALDSISEGGEFAELDRQFRNVAAAAGVSADQIVAAVDDIADGTVRAADRVKIASKAIQTGLSGDDIQSVLQFTKRFTESVGGDFTAMAQQAFEAFQSGRYGVLKQMGLFIEKGATAQEVAAQMRESIGRFGDTGFNVADVMGRISTRVADFSLYVKRAINDSDGFQQIMLGLADAVEYFTEGFDFSVISGFFTATITAAQSLYSALASIFGDVFDYIRSTFVSLTSDSGALDFFVFLADAAGGVAIVISKVFTNITNLGSLIVGGLGLAAEAAADAFKAIEYSALTVGETLTQALATPIFGVIRAIQDLIAESPLLASALGADTLGKGLSSATATLSGIVRSFRDLKDQTLVEESFLDPVRKAGLAMQDLAANVDVSGLTDSVAEALAQFSSDVSRIQLPEVKAPEIKVSQAAIDAFKNTVALRDAAADEDAKKEEKRSSDKARKAAEDEAKEYQKGQEQKKRILEQSMADIAEIEKRMGKQSFTLLTVEETDLLNSKDKIKRALEAITTEERNQRSAQASSLLKGVTDYKQFAKEVTGALGAVSAAGIGPGGKLTVAHKAEEQQFESFVERLLARVGTGGAALAELTRAIIGVIIAQMRGERLPIAVQALPT